MIRNGNFGCGTFPKGTRGFKRKLNLPIGVKNVKGVLRIWGKRMEIKVSEINAPLNLMKRKLSATQFKNGNALPLLSLASTGNLACMRMVTNTR